MGLLVTLFLCGDVMLGRGVDQILPHPVEPTLHESYLKDAREYVRLAEAANGPIPRPVEWEYVWGEALAVLREAAPAASVVNLETAVTAGGEPWPDKGIHYRTHPAHAAVLAAAGIDVATLANNHALDWGRDELATTLGALRDAHVAVAGAGWNLEDAMRPAAVPISRGTSGGDSGGDSGGTSGGASGGEGASGGGGRVLVFAFGSPTAGVPLQWSAEADEPGVALLPRMNDWMLDAVRELIAEHARPGDLVVFSVHWGGNWGYDLPEDHVAFAHRLIDEAGVDIVHGHSSHHALGLEVYRGKLVLYGCGDLITDYEGIGGKEPYRPELTLMYLPQLDAATGDLRALRLVPLRLQKMRLNRATRDEATWLRDMLTRESARFGVRFEVDERGEIRGTW